MSAIQEVIPAAEVRAAEQRRTSLVEKMANKYGLEPNRMMATLKATAFRGDVTNEQMAALLIVADQHNLNPWLKEIYAFPSRQGIVPIVGLDGWARLVNSHPQFDGMELTLSGEAGKEAYTCTIHRKDRAHPISVTEYMIECRRDTDPWRTHPLRMLRHKAMIQCARLAFSFAGIYDPDEGERVLAAENAIDVTPVVDLGLPEGTKEKRIGHTKLRETIEKITKFTENKDGDNLLKLWREFDQEQQLYIWGHMRPWERREFKELEIVARKTTGIGDLPSWAIELARTCKNALEHDKAWKNVQNAFAEADQEVPDSVVMAFDESRSAMGTV